MTKAKDYYEVLGVDKNADDETIISECGADAWK